MSKVLNNFINQMELKEEKNYQSDDDNLFLLCFSLMTQQNYHIQHVIRQKQGCSIDATICIPSVPVCPHSGGVGLCELVQHLILFDYIRVSGSLSNRYELDLFVTT